MIYAEILGTGSYLPHQNVSNSDLSRTVDTSDEWIFSRTGIKNRHIISAEESTSTIALHASRAALDSAKISASDIDLIILATATPDRTFPSTATLLQAELGTKGAAFDISAACSGFVYALNIADSMIKAGQSRYALVIGAESLSRITDWKDRNTCVLFGDGAGAFVLGAVETTSRTAADKGIIASIIHSDGSHFYDLCSSGGPAISKECGIITMNGREVYKHAIADISSVIEELLTHTGLSKNDIDWYVPHQANLRIIESIAVKIDLPLNKFILSIEDTANTSAASIPLAFDLGVKSGKIKRGNKVLIASMGGGFTWGASVFTF